MTLINRVKIYFGAEICEKCGGNDVLQQGYEELNHRHYCRYCGHETVVTRYKV